MISDRQFSEGNSRPKARGLRRLWKPKPIAAIVLLYTCAVLILYFGISNLLGPIDEASADEEVIQITPGMSAMEIGSLLEERGLIRNAFLFRLAGTISGTNRSLKAGEYVLSKNMDTFQILRKIASGEAILHPFTIPEGVTISRIAEYWEDRGFGKSEDFIKTSLDPTIREEYGINFDSMEGYLFPDTYMFPQGISEREAIDKMFYQLDKNVANLMEAAEDSESDDATGMELSRHEVISLASIIEREAGVEREKPIISAVFHNRLKRGRKLESCATVLFSLGYPRRKLTISDLKNTKSPYNTYIHKGLPPGPICNPGRGSIAAAINPSNDRYLYFVSKNDGTHHFSESYNDFLNAKRRYKDG